MGNTYDDYSKNSKKLIKQMFGKKIYKQLKNSEFKGFDWDGLDITTNDILVVTRNIKNRVSKMSAEEEDPYSALDLVISSILHYGYQLAIDGKVKDLKSRLNYAELNRKETREDYIELLLKYKKLKEKQ